MGLALSRSDTMHEQFRVVCWCVAKIYRLLLGSTRFGYGGCIVGGGGSEHPAQRIG